MQKMDAKDREIICITVNSRKRRIYFTEEDDLDLLGLVATENPFLNHKKWFEIAGILKTRRSKDFTAKNIRERVNKLLDSFRQKEPKTTVTSDKGEGLTEKEQRLGTVNDLKTFAAQNPAVVVKVKPGKRAEKEVGKQKTEEGADNLVEVHEFTVESEEQEAASGLVEYFRQQAEERRQDVLRAKRQLSDATQQYFLARKRLKDAELLARKHD